MRTPIMAGNWKMNKNPKELQNSWTALKANYQHQTKLKRSLQLLQSI